MNNYLCYHVHQHSVQPIYVRQTPTVVLHTQQRMPITLDLPPQNIVLRNEEPQPIIVRQQNPNVMIQNESYGCPINALSMDPMHPMNNTTMNHTNNMNISTEITSRTPNFLNNLGNNVIDTTPFDYKSAMHIQEQPLNQTRTIQPFDSIQQYPSQPLGLGGSPPIQVETQGSTLIDNDKEIGMAMNIIEGNQMNKIGTYGYMQPRSNNNMNPMYMQNNTITTNNPMMNNTSNMIEMNPHNNNSHYNNTPSAYPVMNNYQMEPPTNYANTNALNNPLSYMPSTSIPTPPSIIGNSTMSAKPNTNINIPYGNNTTSYMQNKNTSYTPSMENMNYYNNPYTY